MADLLILIILAIILGGAIRYIVKAKKAGVRCIGCSAAGSCSGVCDTNTELTGSTLVMKYRQDYGK